MAAPKEGDLRSGLTALIIGAAILFGVMFAIVKSTNAKYAHEEPAAAEAK